MTGIGEAAAVELVNVPFNSLGLGTGVARMPAALLAAGLAE